MTKSASGSTLYRLIAAGQLARRAALAPLSARGLEPGDDAILLALADPAGTSLEDIVAVTGLPPERLALRLRDMEARHLLLRLAVGPEMVPGARLTSAGQAARAEIEAHWATLEDEVTRTLGKKQHKAMRRALRHVIGLLDRA